MNKEIKKESDNYLKRGSAEEMSDLIFDTLFGNIDFPQFDIKKVTVFNKETETSQEVSRSRKEIKFGYMGHIYKINIELIK